MARFGLGALSDIARFELELQFDLMAAKKIPTNYCKLTLHAILTKLIGSLHKILKIIFNIISLKIINLITTKNFLQEHFF